jgi:membrane protein DedA with SNARE-associated domain
MNLENAAAQILALTSTFDLRIAALLFIICAVGELSIGIPYVLESVWLLAGYQLGAGVLSPFHLAGLWLAAQCGRQAGSFALYGAAKLGTMPLARLYQKCRGWRFWPKVSLNRKLADRINLTSPFSVAYGRLFGLRIPLTITLAVKKRIASLPVGVLLASLIWDVTYITLGATMGKTAVLKPSEMLLATVAGLTLIYLVVFAVRRLLRRHQVAEMPLKEN